MTVRIQTFGGHWDDPHIAAQKAQEKANHFLQSNDIQQEDIVALQTSIQSIFVEHEEAIRIDVVITLMVNYREETTDATDTSE